MKPRILWNAKDHPELPSGYGITGKHLLPRLAKHYGPENILIYAPVYQKDMVSDWHGMKVLPGNEFTYAEAEMLNHYRHFGCNLLIQVGDAWPLGTLPDAAAADKVVWIQWLPVDWVGMPKNILYRIKPAYKLIPFSTYGENQLIKGGLPNVGKKIWLGLDTEIWKPKPREELTRVMDLLGFGYDTFNIVIVAANQERKRVRLQLEAIAIFKQANPQAKPRLYLHSNETGERDLRADLDELQLHDIVAMPDGYMLRLGGIPESEMCMIFNCADIVMNVCMEGFGYSQIQAQACGVPVMSFSEGTGSELVVTGWEIPPNAIETVANQMATPIPNQIVMAQCLTEAWILRQKTGKPMRSEKAVKFIQENFSWDIIASQWIEVIDQCMVDQVKYCMRIPTPSEELDSRSRTILELK